MIATLQLAGFAALLVWGVHMVQTGVQRAFGAKLRHFLAGALRARLHAAAAGLGVTVALQSSKATALMLSAFSAGGLVSLSAGLAAMLGANIGSSLVVQALSFDVAVIAPILVLAGVALFRRAQDAVHDFGRVLIGLGLVLTALRQFLALLEPLATRPDITAALHALDNYSPLLLAGAAAFTWAAHSSVVTVLLAMSLVSQQVISFEGGLAIVLGANLGSAINPALESGREVAARRLAIGNLVNRFVGVSFGLGALALDPANLQRLGADDARALVNIHTLFNLMLAIAFVPWLDAYGRLLERIVPDTAAAKRPGAPIHLDPYARSQPSVALQLAAQEALRMADTVERMLSGLREALLTDRRSAVSATRQLDDVLDGLNHAIKTYVLALPAEAQTTVDREGQTAVLTFAVNLEHAGDLISRDLLSVAERRQARGVAFSTEGEAELVALIDRVILNLHSAAKLFMTRDPALARALVQEKDAFRDIEAAGVVAHFDRLRAGNARTVETSSLHLDALRDLKRINSHVVESAAYPVLRLGGELLPTRLKGTGG